MMVIKIVDNVDNFVDNLWIGFENSNDYYYYFFNLAWFKSQKIERFTVPVYNNRISKLALL